MEEGNLSQSFKRVLYLTKQIFLHVHFFTWHFTNCRIQMDQKATIGISWRVGIDCIRYGFSFVVVGSSLCRSGRLRDKGLASCRIKLVLMAPSLGLYGFV